METLEQKECSIPTKDHNPLEAPFVERYLWKEEYKSLLQSRIWEHRGITFIHLDPERLASREGTTAVPADLVQHEALIWAKDKNELRSLVRLTGYVAFGGLATASSLPDVPMYNLCGIRAEFTDNRRRMIGKLIESDANDWPREYCVDFDIDGAGGEVVTEILTNMYSGRPVAMNVRTNRDREVFWGEEQAINWRSIRAPDNMSLIGVAMTFAEIRSRVTRSGTYVSCGYMNARFVANQSLETC